MKIQFTAYDENFRGSPPTHDQSSPTSKPVHLELVSETLTAREIISEKAKAHFSALKKDEPSTFTSRADLGHWLSANGEMPASVEEAVDAALKAFQNGAFFLFWNDMQVTDLDQRLQVLGNNQARFIQLTPLKGG